MTKLNEIYKCEICGNIVEMVHEGAGELVCCGQPMKLMEEKTSEQEGKEKHVPVIEKTDNGIIVKLGSIPHPMEEAHYIEWIELVTDKKVTRKYLKSGDEPKAKFKLCCEIVKVRAYCNLHGLWRN